MKKGFFNIIPSGDTCTILLFGYIGEYDEIKSSDIVSQLLEAVKTYRRIEVKINSPGGDVFTGIAIYNAIRNVLRDGKAEIVIFVDGVAASMGAVLALSGPRVEASKYAKFMIHGASGGCWGNRKEIEQYLDQMEEIDNTLCQMLAGKCGKTEDEIREAYFDGKDHWFSAQEMLDLGFIDGIYDAEPVAVPENSSPEQMFALFHNRYENSLKQNKMHNKLKNRQRFAACASDDDVLREIEKLETEASKVPGLEETNKTLKQENDAHKAEVQAARDAADEKLLNDSLQAGKIGALDVPIYRAALQGAERESTLTTLKDLPAKRRVTDAIDDKGGKSDGLGAWDARMEEIRKNLKH